MIPVEEALISKLGTNEAAFSKVVNKVKQINLKKSTIGDKKKNFFLLLFRIGS